MYKNTKAICAVCGENRSKNDEDSIAFPTNKYYRSQFAEAFDYESAFIWSLPRSIRICKAHFEPEDIASGKVPTRLPTRELGRVGSWPRANMMSESSGATSRLSARCSPPATSAASSPSSSRALLPVMSAPLERSQLLFLAPRTSQTSASSPSPFLAHPPPSANEEEIVDVVGVDEDGDAAAAQEEEEERGIGENSAAFVEIAQLLLLFRFCYVCGGRVSDIMCIKRVEKTIKR